MNEPTAPFQAPIGTHDVLAPDSAKWEGLIAAFAERAYRYGFSLVMTPIFEDVGVTAYSGAAPLITTPAYLAAAAGILAVEAYHAGLIRTSIFIADPTGKAGLQGYTQQISATRMKLDGSSTVDDIGVGFQTVSVEPASTTNGASTIVDAQTGSPNYSKTYSRSTTQVLQIVTGSVNIPAAGAKYMGVFFPNGLNGLFS